MTQDDLKIKMFDKQVYGDVLIVDDDRDICEVVEGYLKSMDCFRNIICAHDGVSANLKIGLQRFCLILMDLNLPKRTGEDLIATIKEKKEFNSVENVIVMSGTVNQRKLINIRQLGVNKFIIKPFDKDSFCDKVEDFLADKKLMKKAK